MRPSAIIRLPLETFMKFGNVSEVPSIHLLLMQQNFLNHLLLPLDHADSGVQWGMKPDMILTLVELTVY